MSRYFLFFIQKQNHCFCKLNRIRLNRTQHKKKRGILHETTIRNDDY